MTDDDRAPDSSSHATSCTRLRAKSPCHDEVHHILRDACTRLRALAKAQNSVVAAVVAHAIARIVQAMDEP